MNKKDKVKVLFVCKHNSARSQIAEAFLRRIDEDRFEVESAGVEPTALNPLVVEVMQELGIDLSQKKAQSVFELYKEGRLYHYVIAVCSKAVAEKCPIFPNTLAQLHWPFENPEKFTGSPEEKLDKVRALREKIKEKITAWTKNI